MTKRSRDRRALKQGLCPFVLGDERCGVPRSHLNYKWGCQKTFNDCRIKFANQDRFGGRPKQSE